MEEVKTKSEVEKTQDGDEIESERFESKQSNALAGWTRLFLFLQCTFISVFRRRLVFQSDWLHDADDEDDDDDTQSDMKMRGDSLPALITYRLSYDESAKRAESAIQRAAAAAAALRRRQRRLSGRSNRRPLFCQS
ncbi:uncharacterized protein UTRI_02310 [Ustilago trichophora]|uniref:Uncharacterized protein n=1 Tax=Ustilago trichophora TaxID=86804 RepID=A0A5C3E8W1_9BASI|nr:uncharacterized protein UTRI_02310 [Ustilago trichophora]